MEAGWTEEMNFSITVQNGELTYLLAGFKMRAEIPSHQPEHENSTRQAASAVFPDLSGSRKARYAGILFLPTKMF